jgi:hypothetical protein
VADTLNKSKLNSQPSLKLNSLRWLVLVVAMILLLVLTIFTINFNWHKIQNQPNSDDLFGMIKNYFQEGFSKNPPLILPPSLDNQSITNYGQNY